MSVMEKSVIRKLIKSTIYIIVGIILDFLLFQGYFTTTIAPGLARWAFNNPKGALAVAIIVPIVVFILIAVAIRRAEKVWEFGRIYEVYKNQIRNKLWINGLSKAAYYSILFRRYWPRRRVIPDRFPELLRENIVYLFSLNNYLKRFYIWKVKEGQVKGAEHWNKEVWNWIKPYWLYYENYNDLLKDLHSCRNGGTINELDEKGNIIGSIEVGFFPAIRSFCEAINDASELVIYAYNEYLSSPPDPKDPKSRLPLPKTQLDAISARLGDVYTKLHLAREKLDTSLTELRKRGKVFGDLQLVKAQMYIILDQCNPYGEQEHQYRFIPAGTDLVDQFGAISTSHHELEVDMYGQVLEDITKNKNDFYDIKDKKAAIRRVAPHETKAGKIKLLTPPYDIMESIKNDWQAGFRTMRFGRWKKFSKSYKDYVDAMEKMGKEQFYREKNIQFIPNIKEEGTAAFDRRAKVNTGYLSWAGRRNVHEGFEAIAHNPMEDHFPGVSSLGMSRYLLALAEKDTENIRQMNEYLGSFIQDIGLGVESAEETPKTFRPLRGKEEH